jgi:Na+/H+ antiporter NhaD/arsenite permease-like protein
MLLSITNELNAVSALSTIPFILMLASIAIFPILLNKFWEENKNKLLVSLALSIPVIIYLFIAGNSAVLYHTVLYDYIPFLVLLGSLFVITGGIYIDGDIEAKPLVNVSLMAIGAVLASFIGTTGAAMLLIRPLISINSERKYKIHTILFFIAIVANCGGLMTPLGDPPLFVLYLRGAPFFWFFKLAFEWMFVNGLLLLIFFFTDLYYHKREPGSNIAKDKTNIRPITISGKLNFVWLVGVILAVAFVNKQYLPVLDNDNLLFKYAREIIIIICAVGSLLTTAKQVRLSNKFSWAPIIEVAYLFAGIFITMVPCLIYLQLNAQHLGVTTPAQFYYASGILSSFLDNTPTAVTFHSLALGLNNVLAQSGLNMVAGIPENLLKAICLGAVLFGSMTYIGNGPNFMVKSIAEENHINMPHFFKYIYGFSLIVLLPVYVLTHLLFL